MLWELPGNAGRQPSTTIRLQTRNFEEEMASLEKEHTMQLGMKTREVEMVAAANPTDLPTDMVRAVRVTWSV